ncbi:MAG: DNA methyltransferase [Candidatus Bathyarchaeota archaeon]|nr:DNA methyltransferase [Candidatus Bathyarchaeota archaeon]
MEDTTLIIKTETAIKEREIHGFIFACTNKSQEECLTRMLFGTSRQYGAVAMRVKKGDILFLLNIDNDFLFGVFRATADARRNIEPKAWGGNYPYQVTVESLGDILPLASGGKLLKQMGIGRLSVLFPKGMTKLLDFYRPLNTEVKEWRKEILTGTGKIQPSILEPRNWELLGKVQKIKDIEEIPELQATTFWDFPRQNYGKNKKGNNKYAGVTPAELIWNLVWRYTEPGDLVVDPMCGSGTTLDVCNEEGRKAICYDVKPPEFRNDILQNDARQIPLFDNSVDLVFIDSPYGDNIKYNEHPANIGLISSETEEFYSELEEVITEAYRILKPGKVLGWLIGDQWVKKKATPVGFLLYSRLTKYFDTVDIVCVARRNQSSNTGIWANRARRFNFYLRGFKYLFILRKPVSGEKTEEPREISWTYYTRERKKPN